ncbi:MAG TPA: ABC transporter permease subunit [Clostridiales bacterium]|nr:ABC transporter permease subunit [Clostridiales bacterium]
MINMELYKHTFKEIWKMLLIFATILTMYFIIIIYMFDPKLGAVLDEFTKALPEVMAMFGMVVSSTTLLGFLSTYLYGFLMLVFPMIFTIIVANRLIARHVDRGSMTYLLAAPVNRKTVAFTQMKVLATGIFLLVLYTMLIGIIASELSFPAELEIGKFVLLNIGVLSLHFFIGGISFLSSCIFNDTKKSVAFGAGIPALAYIIQMLANAGEKAENLKYITFFTLFNANELIAGKTTAIYQIVILFLAAIVLFVLGIIVFDRKDLHI